MTARAAGAPDYIGSATAHSKGGPVENTNLFNKIFAEVYEQYPKGFTTKEIDQPSSKLASVIPEWESTEMPATTADLTAECSVPLDTDLDKL